MSIRASEPTSGVTGAAVSSYVFWLWGILLLLPVWVPRYFVTEDGLAHLYWIEVYRELGAPDHAWHAYFQRQLDWTTPYHFLHFGLQYALAGFLEAHLAQKVVVTIVVLSWVGAIRFLAVSLTGRLTIGAFTALLLVHSAFLYNGYFAFLGAMPLVLVALGVLARLGSARGEGAFIGWCVLLAGLSMLAHFAHFFVGALFLLLCGLWLVYPWHSTPPPRAAIALAMLPTALLASWYLLRGTFGAGGMVWEPLYRAVARFAGLAFFRGFAAPGPLFWLALTAFGVALAVLALPVLGALRDRRSRSRPLFVAHLALLLAAMFFVAPVAMGEALNFNGRIQLALWAWLLPTLPYHLAPRMRVPLLLLVNGLLLWQVVTFTLRGQRLSSEYDRVLSQAAAIPEGSLLKSEVEYENTRYEGSFMHVLADLPEDIAFRRRSALLDSFFPALPYYWIRPRGDAGVRAQLAIDLRHDSEAGLSLVIRSAE